MNNRKVIYISTATSLQITDRQLQMARYACEHAIREGFTPISPILLYSGMMDDTVDSLSLDAFTVLSSNLLSRCDEMWAYGSAMSENMYIDATAAKTLDIPVRYYDHDTMMGDAPKAYAIWVETSKTSLLHGEAGYLFAHGFPLRFETVQQASNEIACLQSLRMGTDNRATYYVSILHDAPSPAGIDREQVRAMETYMLPGMLDSIRCEQPFSEFIPHNGPESYMPVHFESLGKTVWACCNLQGFSVYAMDPSREENQDEYQKRCIYSTYLEDASPQAVEPWAEVAKNLLLFQVQEEHRYRDTPVSLPPKWAGFLYDLPNTVVAQLESEGEYYPIPGGQNAAKGEPYIDKNLPEWFDESKLGFCELSEKMYWDTGGNCYVLSFKARLPGTDEWMWVSSNNEAFNAYLISKDAWEEQEFPNMDKPPLMAFLYESAMPSETGLWLPLAYLALEEYIYAEYAHSHNPVTVPTGWIPPSLSLNQDMVYIAWLNENPQPTEFDGNLQYLDEYLHGSSPSMDVPT